MLYKLNKTGDKFDSIEPQEFRGLPLEKDLEILLAKNLWDILFEGNELMPIFQERVWQPEADIYALNRRGELVIFELKREQAGSGAVHQVLRYSEKAARFSYENLQAMYRSYSNSATLNLQTEHQNAFSLEHHLDKSAFNSKQRLIVIGSAGDDDLIRNVDYWKSQGILIDFLPYRVYVLKHGESSEYYFEFFSLPYDHHSNPADAKGVLFDTCRTHIPDSVWYMCENDRVAAFGDQSHVVSYLNKNDFVFLYDKGVGIIAAGKVKGKVEEDKTAGAHYRNLEWLTATPQKGSSRNPAMSPGQIKELLGHDFFWARTIKSPYLSIEESKTLLTALIGVVCPKS